MGWRCRAWQGPRQASLPGHCFDILFHHASHVCRVISYVDVLVPCCYLKHLEIGSQTTH